MKADGGFTLLELLIGLTLFGFVLALLFGGFRLASTSWDAVAAHSEKTADQQLGRTFLRRLLNQVQPLRWKKVVNQPLAFSGDKTVLRAIATLPGQSGSGGLRVIELAAEPAEGDDGPFRLIMRHAPLRRDAEQFIESLTEGGEGHVLLNGLEAIEFQYFGPEKADDPLRWQQNWMNPTQLPQLITVRLSAKEAGWTDLVVAPMLNGTGCRWDNFHSRCM